MNGESKEELTAGMAIGFLLACGCNRNDSGARSDVVGLSVLVIAAFEFVYAGGWSSVLSRSSDSEVWTESEVSLCWLN